jgi:hypothetical protein
MKEKLRQWRVKIVLLQTSQAPLKSPGQYSTAIQKSRNPLANEDIINGLKQVHRIRKSPIYITLVIGYNPAQVVNWTEEYSLLDLTPCSKETVRRLGGTWTLSLPSSGSKGKQKRNYLAACFCWFLTWLTIWFWRWVWYVPPKRRALSQLCGVKPWRPGSSCITADQWNGYLWKQELKMGIVKFSFWMKSTIFWDMTPCSPFSVNRRFGGTYHLHLQSRRNKFSMKPASKQVASRIIRQPEIRVYIGNGR